MHARTSLLLATLFLWEGFSEGASPRKVLKRMGRGARVPPTAEKAPFAQWESSFANDAALPPEISGSVDRSQSPGADASIPSGDAQNGWPDESAPKGTNRDLNLTLVAPLAKAATGNADVFGPGWFDRKARFPRRKPNRSYLSDKTRLKSPGKSRGSPDLPDLTSAAQAGTLTADRGKRLNSSEISQVKLNPEEALISPPQREAVWEENAKDKTSGASAGRQGAAPRNRGPKSVMRVPAGLRKDRVASVATLTVDSKGSFKGLSPNRNSEDNACAGSESADRISPELGSRRTEDRPISTGRLGWSTRSEPPLPAQATPRTVTPASGEGSSAATGSELQKTAPPEKSRSGAVDLGESGATAHLSVDARQRSAHSDRSHILRLQTGPGAPLDPSVRAEVKAGSGGSVESHFDGRGLVFQVEDGQSQAAGETRSRSRRSWIWNQFFVIEEYSGPEPVLIGRLRTDMDKGDGRTRYVLRGEGAGSVFVIDEKTGNIHVTKPLDREEKDEYRLVATATDRQTDRALEPSSQFIIRVQDINDNPPVFQDGPYSATIPEMANIGTSIIQVTATDADDPTYGNSAKLVYTLTQGQQYFSVDPQTGILRTAVPDMDRETQDQYLVVLQAKDMGGHLGGLSGTTTVTVRLSDVNDNPPRFTHSSWSFSVSELALPGAEVGRLSATDTDLGDNAKMEFAILDGEGSDTFNITGLEHEAVITLNKAVDYESRRSYSFAVEVLNPTVDPRFLRRGPFKDRASVRVSVLDADEPPRFSKTRYLLDVYENCPPPCPAGRVDAVDPDSGLSSSVRFSIDPQSDPETLFRITPDSGLITTAAELDRERERWHNITVIATQRDSPAQVSRAVVAIETLDVNDNAPELDRQYTTVLCDSAAVGQVVQVLRAVDKDQGGNDSAVHFSIAAESRVSRNFSIRESGGRTASLVLQSPLPPLSRSPASSLTLQVPLVLRDGRSDLSSTGTLTVSVCPCVTGSGKEAACLPLPSASPSPGLSTAALLAILACVATLLAVSALSLSLRRQKRDSLSPLEEDDVRENIITYDDEGGGEADTAAFNIAALQSAPQSSRRGYRTLDSRNIRYAHRNPDRGRTSLWAQNPSLDPHFPLQEATLYGRLFYSSHTLPVLRSVHGPFEPGLSFPGALHPSLVLQNQGLDKPGASKEGSEGQGATGGSDCSSMQTAEFKENHSSSEPSDGQLDQDRPTAISEEPHSTEERSARWLSSSQSGAEPTGPGSAAAGAESAGDGQQGEQRDPPEGTLGDFGGLELGSAFVGPRPELEGGVAVTGTTCSLYQEGLGFIADWRNRMGIGGYVLGRREMIPQLLPFAGQLGYAGGRGRSMEAGGGGAGTLALKVGEFLRLRLAQVTFDPSLPPYDSVQIYGFEGEGSQAGSLSSLGSEGDKEASGDWGDGPSHWGPQFQRLAEILHEREREPPEEREGERESPVVAEESREEESEKPAESKRDEEGEEGASME